MGIRHLYSHLTPYAEPETFGPPSDSKTAIYIDGPALCYHVYHLVYCVGNPIGGNAFENTISYRTFALAFGSYLERLEISGFEIKKILFDSALPASKTKTRLSRLSDSLLKLSRYRSENPTLHHGTPSAITSPEILFSPETTTAFSPRTQPLSAPPFIVGAALSWLAAHSTFRSLTETVPGEADSFLAAAAIRNGGIILTGDSDLLVFSGCGRDWGVAMMQDITFASNTAKARVFRPTKIAARLKFPLIEIAYQTSLDPYVSLSRILERLHRVEERKKQGVGIQVIPDWFVNEYTLPSEAARIGRTVEEPRIGELLFLAASEAEKRKMYLPFLFEDPQRAPAWKVGEVIRTMAYSLLFTDGEVKEVFRRETKIADSTVRCVASEELVAKVESLSTRINANPDTWWVTAILDDICDIARSRHQSPPSHAELTAAASVLLAGAVTSRPPTPLRTKQKWAWALVQLFASLQAGWYSLLLLREVLAFLGDRAAEYLETLRKALLQLPDVLELFDGRRFLGAFEDAASVAKELGKAALTRYRTEAERESEECGVAENDETHGKDKQGSMEAQEGGQWAVAKSKGTKRRRNKKNAEMVGSGSRFAMLTADL